MAEEHPRPIRRIKIKFGSTVVATQAVRIPGLVSSASAESKDAKPGCLARLRQASLQGYVPPTAAPDAIVARLREGEGIAPGAELPAWDFTVPSASNCQERPAKRSRLAAVVADACAEPCRAASASDQPAAGVRSLEGAGPGRPDPPLEPPQPTQPANVGAVGRASAAAGSGESNSDQATTSQAYLPLSPDECADGAGRGNVGAPPPPHAASAGQSSLASSAQLGAQLPPRLAQSAGPAAPAPAASVSVAGSAPPIGRGHGGSLLRGSSPCAVAGSCSPVPIPRDPPSTTGRQPQPTPPTSSQRAPSGVSVETQTTHRDFPVLPTSFLELPRLSGTALSYQSIGPFDLQLEREQANGAVESIEAWMEEARRLKKEGDALCQRNNKVWTIRSLCKYVSSALLFMEAADAMVKDRHRQSSSQAARAAGLYQQTGNLLGYTVNFADTLKGNGVGKEALRLLAERLCAICLLRQTSLLAGNFRVSAEKAQAALRDHSRQQAAHGAGAGGAVGSTGAGQQPSPEDSSTSTLHAAHGSTVAGGAGGPQGSGSPASLPGFPPERVSELLEYAKTTARFTEAMKRSCKSFEAFVERADVRQDQQAKLVSMHLAAVCMDMGMASGLRVIHHAREAVRTLCDDLAR